MLGGLNGCFDFLRLFFQGEHRGPWLGRCFKLVLRLKPVAMTVHRSSSIFRPTVAPDDLGRLSRGVLDEVVISMISSMRISSVPKVMLSKTKLAPVMSQSLSREIPTLR